MTAMRQGRSLCDGGKDAGEDEDAMPRETNALKDALSVRCQLAHVLGLARVRETMMGGYGCQFRGVMGKINISRNAIDPGDAALTGRQKSDAGCSSEPAFRPLESDPTQGTGLDCALDRCKCQYQLGEPVKHYQASITRRRLRAIKKTNGHQTRSIPFQFFTNKIDMMINRS